MVYGFGLSQMSLNSIVQGLEFRVVLKCPVEEFGDQGLGLFSKRPFTGFGAYKTDVWG